MVWDKLNERIFFPGISANAAGTIQAVIIGHVHHLRKNKFSNAITRYAYPIKLIADQ